MKVYALSAALLVAATSVSAMDLPIAGLSLNTDVVLEHKLDAETTQLDITPELAYAPSIVTGFEVTAGTSFDVWDRDGGFTLSDEFDAMPTIDFGATYVLPMVQNVELGIGTSYDFEATERSDVTMTATFSF